MGQVRASAIQIAACATILIGCSPPNDGMSPEPLPSASMPSASMPSAANECPRVELFSNGHFDAGDTGWSQGSANWDALIVDAQIAGNGVAAQSGTHFARLGGYLQTADELTGQDSLIAPMMVPESATDIVFSYYSIVTSEEPSPEPRDTLFMSLDTDVQYVMQFLDNTTLHAEWQRYEQPIDPSAAGKTVVMVIRALNDAAAPTTFLLDSMSLSASVCP